MIENIILFFSCLCLLFWIGIGINFIIKLFGIDVMIATKHRIRKERSS